MASFERKMPRAELKAQAKKIMKKNRLMFTLISFIYIICVSIYGFSYQLQQETADGVVRTVQAKGPGAFYAATEQISSFSNWQLALFGIIGLVCGLLVNGVIAYTYNAWCLKQTQYPNKKLGFADYIDGFGDAFKAILTYIWQNIWLAIWGLTVIPGFIVLIMGVAAVMAGEENAISLGMIIGGILLILASFVIVFIVGLRYTFMYQVLADGRGRCGARQSMRYSIAVTKTHLDDVFVLLLSFIPWYILGFITFGIGLLYVYPYVSTTMALSYAWLRDEAFREGRLHPSKLGYTTRNPQEAKAAAKEEVPAEASQAPAISEKAEDAQDSIEETQVMDAITDDKLDDK